MRYDRLSAELLRQVEAKAVLVSGNTTEFQHFDQAKLSGLRDLYRAPAQPTMGFCAGAQMMAETYGSTAAAIDAAGQGDMSDESWKKRAHEWGFTPVRQIGEHALFAGLSPNFTVMEAHYWEIKGLPEGFTNLAETDISPLQLIAHDSLPLYGSQFHPEKWDADHPDGRKFLENFFKLAGLE